MKFSDKLHELRKQAGLSQAQLAAASRVPVWTLRGYEQGRREPLWLVLFKLADALGVSVEEFRDCLPGKRPAKVAPRSGAPARRTSPTRSRRKPASAKTSQAARTSGRSRPAPAKARSH
jgi:transcriptional regulator with XRE-family HTH domain